MASWTTNKARFDVLTRANAGGAAAVWKVLLVDTEPASAAAAADLNFVAEVVANELADASYSRKTLANVTVTEDDTGDAAFIDADDPVWTALAGAETAVGAWVYREVSNDADSVLYAFVDSNDLATNGGDVTLTFHAEGFVKIG